ncbi:hypothetical protein BHM03_00058697 [Ensete ventricosum]|nr:hypothetical protein BHM03_00058697 [Ensete ventricosum]
MDAVIVLGSVKLRRIRYRPRFSSSGSGDLNPGVLISPAEVRGSKRRLDFWGGRRKTGDMGLKWRSGRLWTAVLVTLVAAVVVVADRGLKPEEVAADVVAAEEVGLSDYVLKVVDFLWQPDKSSYQHVWPPMKLGWQIVVGTIIGFLGSAFGSVGGVGGGGIYVPMLTLIIGFDAKSSTAISKCEILYNAYTGRFC